MVTHPRFSAVWRLSCCAGTDVPLPGTLHRRTSAPRLAFSALGWLVALACLPQPVRGTEHLVNAVFDAWEANAAAVETLHVVFQAEDVRPAGLLPAHLGRFPNQHLFPSTADLPEGDIVLRTQIDYSFARGGRERLRRWGDCPTSQKGIVPYDVTYVRRGSEVRDLSSGSAVGPLPYDTFGIRERSYLIEAHLLPLHLLLNVAAGDRPYLERDGVSVLADFHREINGVPCMALQRHVQEDTLTVWCDERPPYRIHRVEMTSTRRLGHDMRFVYAEQEPSSGFVVPWLIEVAAFSPSRQLQSLCRLTTIKAEVNPMFSDDVFELEPPVGALVTDFRPTPVEFKVRMPDGRDRPLARHEHANGAFLRTSAAIPGSKVFGQFPVQEPTPPAEEGAWKGRPGGWSGFLLIVLNVLAGITLLAYCVWSRRQIQRS